MRNLRPIGIALIVILSSVSMIMAHAVPGGGMKEKLIEVPELAWPLRLSSIRVTTDGAVSAAGEGRSVELSIVTEEDYYLGPIVVWMSNRTGEAVLVNSIPSVNAVLRDLDLAAASERQTGVIYTIIGLLVRQYPVEGNSMGVALFEGNRHRLLKLIESKVPRERFRISRGNSILLRLRCSVRVGSLPGSRWIG